MGFDVYGKHPAAPAGRYFRNSVSWWHPLWEYVLQVAPWVERKAPLGHYNAGDGLDGSQATELAAVLTAELEAGTAYAYELRHTDRVKALAREDHWLSRG